jgi:putative membrane protein
MNIKTLIATTTTFALFAGLAVTGSQKALAANGPSDTQIAGIVLTADNLDISYGKIALAKSKNPAIREFAQRMVTDHQAVQLAVVDLAEKLGVNADDSAVRTSLRDGSKAVFEKLNSLEGAEFDKYYIDNEVAYHKAVTDAVDAVLIPSAQNSDLKAALTGSQPLFLKHLEHARMVQENYGKSGAMMKPDKKMSKSIKH